ncbi:MAG: sugar transferase [Oscillospiraceae bacterium]|nr:sugar transferase [Oscillospiraceae bacterium]
MEAVDLTKQKAAANEKSEFCEKPVYDHLKRLFDIICSLLAIIVLSPLLIITAIAITAEDFGNPFFIQERIGHNGKNFKMIKFRSMHLNAESELEPLLPRNEYRSIHFKMENDPRITKVGRLIRPVSIDELPQLFNVLMGDMSIIGPRPFIASEQEQLPDDRLFVKPGLSCYWQIANTTKMSSEEQLELDYRYIRERSFPTDIKIILKTIVVVFKGKNS